MKNKTIIIYYIKNQYFIITKGITKDENILLGFIYRKFYLDMFFDKNLNNSYIKIKQFYLLIKIIYYFYFHKIFVFIIISFKFNA